jgi:CheY-like chemotaxis protein
MKNIVVIDDDDDVREVIVYALESEGLAVKAFVNGKEGMEALQTLGQHEMPGLIIVDYMMPEMDGITFIKEVREKFPQTLGKVPLAISSAMGASDPIFQEIGNLILMHKPMDLEDLIKIAKHHCQ